MSFRGFHWVDFIVPFFVLQHMKSDVSQQKLLSFPIEQSPGKIPCKWTNKFNVQSSFARVSSGEINEDILGTQSCHIFLLPQSSPNKRILGRGWRKVKKWFQTVVI